MKGSRMSLTGVALVGANKLLKTVRWNTPTYNVMKLSEKMLLDIVNIGTSLRGFVAVGEEPIKLRGRQQKSFRTLSQLIIPPVRHLR